MGLVENKLQNMQGMASRKMQQETGKLSKQLKGFESEVVDSNNWIMKAIQKIANKLEITLDDPLEE